VTKEMLLAETFPSI